MSSKKRPGAASPSVLTARSCVCHQQSFLPQTSPKPLKRTSGTWFPCCGGLFSWCSLSRLEKPFSFARIEDTGGVLKHAGASPWNVYTRNELRILMAQNRIAPLTVSELNLLHAFKRT